MYILCLFLINEQAFIHDTVYNIGPNLSDRLGGMTHINFDTFIRRVGLNEEDNYIFDGGIRVYDLSKHHRNDIGLGLRKVWIVKSPN